MKKVELNGYKIGFPAFAHHEFGMSTSFNAECGAAWINDPCVDEIVVEGKKELNFKIS